MAMFSNSRNLELVNQFASFIDLVTNPDKFKASIDSAKQTSAELKERLQAWDTVQEANKFLDKARQTAEKAETDAKVKLAQVEKEVTTAKEYVVKLNADSSAKAVAISEAATKLAEAQQECENLKKSLAVQEVYLTERAAQLDKKEANLNSAMSDLQAKQSKLQEILG